MFEQKYNSKGNQVKLRTEDGSWIKLDYLGYESLSEYVVSSILKHSNFDSFVEYDITTYSDKGIKSAVSCVSKDFKVDCDIEISVYDLFCRYRGVDLYLEIENPIRSTEDCIRYIVNEVEAITGIKEFGKYFTTMIEIDAFFLNEDRHLRNIILLYNDKTDEFKLAPLFDFGASLLSDTRLYYPLDGDTKEYMSEVKAKPISPDFDEQLEACRRLYGSQFKFNFSECLLENILDHCSNYYSDRVIDRVRTIIHSQICKYADMVNVVD